MMLSDIPIEKILFLDIETVPQYADWNSVDEDSQALWAKKTERQRGEEYTAEEFYEMKAGIWAEFGKVVCISCGLVVENKARIKSFIGDEISILEAFKSLVKSEYFQSNPIFCAHNGKEFDYPYLSRRMLMNEISLPTALQNYGKKPWEINHLDTLELWKFGDYKHYTSLELLAHIFKLPTPKGEMNGSEVKQVYYQEKNIDKIVKYCENDVLTLINIFRKMRVEPEIERES